MDSKLSSAEGLGEVDCFLLGQNIKLWSDAAPCSMNTPLHPTPTPPFDPILYHCSFSIGKQPSNYRKCGRKNPTNNKHRFQSANVAVFPVFNGCVLISVENYSLA